MPWLGSGLLGGVIACRRWSGAPLLASLALGTAATFLGWRRVCRWGERQHDLAGARLLQAVPDPEPWVPWVHPVQVLKAAHLGHCQRRWGVNARSSGWERMQRSAWLDLAGVPGCLLLALHSWWFPL